MWLLVSFRSSLAVDKRPQTVPCHESLYSVAYNVAACLPSEWETGEKESEKVLPRQDSLYNLISEVVSHHFCHILFFRSESLNPYSGGGDNIRLGMPGAGDYWCHLELPTTVSIFIGLYLPVSLSHLLQLYNNLLSRRVGSPTYWFLECVLPSWGSKNRI